MEQEPGWLGRLIKKDWVLESNDHLTLVIPSHLVIVDKS